MELEMGGQGNRRRFFVSYRHGAPDDVELARYLARELEAAGHEVFIDTALMVGTDWVVEIGERIGWCDFLVVLLSQRSLHSEMVQAEIRQAHQRRQREGKPKILPLRVGYEGPLDYELDAYLARRQQALWRTAADSPRILREILAQVLDEGREPTAAALSSSQPLDSGDRPVPAVDPRAFSAPGGTLRLDDPFYLERTSDALALERARLPGETVVIKAPRQLGKSSLLLRYLAACRALGKKVAFLDFSVLADLEMKDYPTLLGEIAGFLAHKLAGGVAVPKISRQAELTRFLEDVVLPAVGGPVVLAFDEVDRVLGRPFQADFFTLLRMWHNLRAGFESAWERVDLALVISTEPYLLIEAADRSPFNVTPPIELAGFSRDQCAQLNRCYGAPLGASELDELYVLLAGHPYLTRLAFYRLVSADRTSFRALMSASASGDGPFGDHLRALLLKLSAQPGLGAAMRAVIVGEATPEPNAYHRLHGSGLARREGNRVIASNRLYERFFGSVLK